MLFGDESTVRKWETDRRIQLHGPGWSKVVFGDDQIDNWRQHLDVMIESISSNSGRSCLNASGVWVPRYGREIAEALAQRLAQVTARAMDDPEAQLAAFVNPKVAERMSEMIDNGLRQGGAEDITAKYRKTPRLIKKDGATFLLPTIVWCESPEHPLTKYELLFPFASVVEMPQAELIERMGYSLVVTAITDDRQFIQKLMAAKHIDRLNLGPIPTNRISWDQPHEGNLFEHLYRQRAFQLSIDY
jgi:acyl-CoA reductase-like NAD-dependent aldehyde dehydrogenase